MLFRLCALASFCFALSCGFTPVYKTSQGATPVQEQTSEIKILPVPEQSGRILVQNLKSLLNPQNISRPKKYELSITLSETINNDQGILGDNTATRSTMRVTAAYTLMDIESKEILLKNSTFAISSYNILTAPYATVVSEQTTRERLIEILADNIALRMANYFKGLEQK